MLIIQRHVQEIKNPIYLKDESIPMPVEKLRSMPAWILLGEPGAGKSTLFSEEANVCKGQFISIAEFIGDEVRAEWKGKTLFLDGLDEIRSSGVEKNVFITLRSQLRRLGNPRFRISCRAADWFCESDKSILITASPNGKLPTFNLLPMQEQEILTVLQQNLKITNPRDFIDSAKRYSIGSLLGNPKSLELLTKDWAEITFRPITRQMVYNIACLKQAKESRKTPRDQLRNNPVCDEEILDAAGYIFAVQLISNKTGIALDEDSQCERFPTLNAYNPPKLDIAAQSLRRMIFTVSATHEDRLEPSHRTTGEYLAARWLAKEIDQNGLPLGRVLNLVLGFDRKTVTGLKGLYAWLALLSQKARQQLIELDPITVILYSDIQPMTKLDKQWLLQALKNESQNRMSFMSQLCTTSTQFNLYDQELTQDFISILTTRVRDDSTQTFVTFILKSLGHVALPSILLKQIKGIAADDNWWQRIRTQAIKVWLKQNKNSTDAIDFLNLIHKGVINDPDDELAGLLLFDLYPLNIESIDLLKYLHTQKEPSTIGMYIHFWAYQLPIKAPSAELGIILDQLSLRTDNGLTDWIEQHYRHMVGELLVRIVKERGEQITNQKLYRWLSIGTNQYGENRREKDVKNFLSIWLSQHPERYKGLLKICFEQSVLSKDPLRSLFNSRNILLDAMPPEDIGLWHFEQLKYTYCEELANEHLSRAMRTLALKKGDHNLTFEMILSWAEADLKNSKWLEPHLYWIIPESRKVHAETINLHNQEHSISKLERTIHLTNVIEKIRDGRANPALMHELAGVWLGLYTNTLGDSPLDRFKSYCDNFEDVFDATQSGLRKCLHRKDLPTVQEIIDLYLQQREHFLQRACLLGMELNWMSDAKTVIELDELTLQKMISFRLTDAIGNTPNWFLQLAEQQPELVAHVMFQYANAGLAAKKDHIDGLYQLLHETSYQKVAVIIVPKLLRSFPTRVKTSQLHNLEYLLKSGIRYFMPDLLEIINSKSKLKSLDISQRVYWLTAGMIIDPVNFESKLWNIIGKSRQRGNAISNFLRSHMSELQLEFELSAQTLSNLIEILNPQAELEWPKDFEIVSESMELGVRIRALISRLAALGSKEALFEMERLLNLSGLDQAKIYLEHGRHELQQRLREHSFSFPSLSEISQILLNKSPANPSDLAELVVSHIDDIASEIQESKSDIFRQFWYEKPTLVHKNEISCRDVILEKLKQSLRSFGLNCKPEEDYSHDQRADIRVFFKNVLELPIKIRGEWHSELWTTMNEQLIEKYTLTKNTAGFAIYIALWFDGDLQPPPNDKGKYPTSARELQKRLQAMVPMQAKKQIYVRVFDVSWPVN